MANEIQQAAGKGVQVVDSRNGVARQALKMLRATKESGQTGLSKDDQTFFVTGKLSSLQEKEYRQLCTALSIPWGGSFFKE